MEQNSTIISYQASFNAISSPNGSISMQTPLVTDIRSKKQVRLIRASISSSLPNIYSAYGNNTCKVSRDGGANWSTIVLPTGIYTVNSIQQAINDAVSAWYTAPGDPALLIAYNAVTELVYITIDSTKLVAPGTQMCIDLSPSLIYMVLGYNIPANQVIIIDGTFGADSAAQIDWFGNNISVQITGLGSLSYRQGVPSGEICQIPLSTTTVTNEYIYPLGGIPSPFLSTTCGNRLESLSFVFTGSRFDLSGSTKQYRPVFVMDGEASVIIQIVW